MALLLFINKSFSTLTPPSPLPPHSFLLTRTLLAEWRWWFQVRSVEYYPLMYVHCYLSMMRNCSVRKICNLMVLSISKAWCCPPKVCMVMPKTMMMICGTKETWDFCWGVCPGASYNCGSAASGHATFVLSQQAYTRRKKKSQSLEARVAFEAHLI